MLVECERVQKAPDINRLLPSKWLKLVSNIAEFSVGKNILLRINLLLRIPNTAKSADGV